MKIFKNKRAVGPIAIVVAAGIGLLFLPFVILGFTGMTKLLTLDFGKLQLWSVAIIIIFLLMLIKKKQGGQ